MKFDLIIYTCAEYVDMNSARNVTRFPCYMAYAKAMKNKGKVLLVPHYLSVFPGMFNKPQKILGRLFTPTIHQLSDNLYIYKPLVPGKLGPMVNFSPLLRGCQLLLKRQIKNALHRIGAKEPLRVVSVDDPFHFTLLGLADESLATYDCLDDYSLYGEAKDTNSLVLKNEQKLAYGVDLIFATARALCERLKGFNANTFYSPNAVDFTLFNKSTLKTTFVAHDLNKIPNPVIGFIGNLNLWFDYGLLQKIIAAKPEWSFVFVGEVADNYRSIREGIAIIKHLPNVHFLGWQPMNQMPSYLKGFDVAILPYKQNKVTDTINPNKLYQLMAGGIPIVSTPVPEVAQYREVISIASKPLDFIRAIEERLATKRDDARIKNGVAIARRNSWDRRVEQRLGIISTYLKAKSKMERRGLPSAVYEENKVT
jgi:glycosyltransferase involved in cell wall biosynthesis